MHLPNNKSLRRKSQTISPPRGKHSPSTLWGWHGSLAPVQRSRTCAPRQVCANPGVSWASAKPHTGPRRTIPASTPPQNGQFVPAQFSQCRGVRRMEGRRIGVGTGPVGGLGLGGGWDRPPADRAYLSPPPYTGLLGSAPTISLAQTQGAQQTMAPGQPVGGEPILGAS